MKEVKLVNLELDSGSRKDPQARWLRPGEQTQAPREVAEQYLAQLLNDGWQVAGTGGGDLSNAFVILVRER